MWAGVDSVPKLVVDADMFEVTFHSDGSNVDWGFKLLAHGIMEEPSAEDRAALKALRRKVA